MKITGIALLNTTFAPVQQRYRKRLSYKEKGVW